MQLNRGGGLGSLLAEALPIVRVEVPGAALRLPLVGQKHSEPASHPAVEVIHHQRLAARGPVFELRRLDQKVRVLEQLERRAKGVCRLLDGLQRAEVSGPEDQQPGRPEPLPRAPQLRAQAAVVAPIFEAQIGTAPPGSLDLQSEMPHGGQKESRALLMTRNVREVFDELHLKHRVGGSVQARSAQIDAVKLIGKQQKQAIDPAAKRAQRPRLETLTPRAALHGQASATMARASAPRAVQAVVRSQLLATNRRIAEPSRPLLKRRCSGT